MRIGQLTDCYVPVLNGVTNMVRTHKAQLERLGHQAPVFTAGHLDYVDEEADIVRSWGLPLGGTGYCAAPGYGRHAQVRLARMDVLHAHHPFVAGRLALRYGRRFGQPVVYTNHTRLDLYAGVYVPRPLRGLARRILRRYMPRFATQCDLIIAPSAGLAKVMREQWGVKRPVTVVPNGIDLARFRRPERAVSRTDLGLPPSGSLAIYTGRLGVEKNLPFMLRAFAQAVPDRPEARLLLLGDGPQAAALRELAGELRLGERVFLPGGVPYEQVPAYLAAADLFVSASFTEVHPMSLIEGLAAGLPALGVISPGVADTVEDGVNGLLTAHDVDAFSRALRRLLTDADLRARLAEGARRSSARYSIARTTGRMVELYQRLLNHRARTNAVRS
jgi:glycosyltransferase involved in cell wall biosynthesis